MVETTASLATMPVSRATAACHSPKPSGLKTGAMKRPNTPRIEVSGVAAAASAGVKFCSNQMTIDIRKMIVPALVMKSLAFSHMPRTVPLKVGRR